jgi:hypothetical protein
MSSVAHGTQHRPGSFFAESFLVDLVEPDFFAGSGISTHKIILDFLWQRRIIETKGRSTKTNRTSNTAHQRKTAMRVLYDPGVPEAPASDLIEPGGGD